MAIMAGKLRHRVTLQSKSVTRSASGAEVVTWSDEATVWCAVEPQRGREYLDGLQIHDEQIAAMTIRYYSGVVPEWRATWNSRTYDIVEVRNWDERNREMLLICREVT